MQQLLVLFTLYSWGFGSRMHFPKMHLVIVLLDEALITNITMSSIFFWVNLPVYLQMVGDFEGFVTLVTLKLSFIWMNLYFMILQCANQIESFVTLVTSILSLIQMWSNVLLIWTWLGSLKITISTQEYVFVVFPKVLIKPTLSPVF